VAIPVPLTVLTAGFEELHAAVPVTFCVDPSLKVALAVNCCVPPVGVVADGGVTVTPTNTTIGDTTESVVEPPTDPIAALIVVVPAVEVLARPPDGPDVTVATEEFEEDQTAMLVTSKVLELL
jgi:hypothetical protein